MALFSRRERPPADVLAVLDSDERAVSWGDTDDGAAVVATPKGLWWPDGDGYRRIAWQHIDKAVWRDSVLSVIEADVVDDLLLVDREPVSVTITTPRDLPPTVRKRVDANVVRTQLLPVTGGAARFVARRVPGRDGVVWWARLEPGVLDDEAVRASVSRRIAELAAETAVGLTG
jgi:hypothetical protein